MPRTDLLSQAHPEKRFELAGAKEGGCPFFAAAVCSLNCAFLSASHLCTEKCSNLCNFGALAWYNWQFYLHLLAPKALAFTSAKGSQSWTPHPHPGPSSWREGHRIAPSWRKSKERVENAAPDRSQSDGMAPRLYSFTLQSCMALLQPGAAALVFIRYRLSRRTIAQGILFAQVMTDFIIEQLYHTKHV